MENKNEKSSLIEVLSLSKRSDLGKEWDGKKLWLKAIIKVQKCDNSINYALADNDGYNSPSITRDFGNMAKIVKILAIYPTYYLSENQRPNLKNKSDIINYLAAYGCNEAEIEYLLADQSIDGQEKTAEQKKTDKDKVKSMLNCVMIKSELKAINAEIG